MSPIKSPLFELVIYKWGIRKSRLFLSNGIVLNPNTIGSPLSSSFASNENIWHKGNSQLVNSNVHTYAVEFHSWVKYV